MKCTHTLQNCICTCTSTCLTVRCVCVYMCVCAGRLRALQYLCPKSTRLVHRGHVDRKYSLGCSFSGHGPLVLCSSHRLAEHRARLPPSMGATRELPCVPVSIFSFAWVACTQSHRKEGEDVRLLQTRKGTQSDMSSCQHSRLVIGFVLIEVAGVARFIARGGWVFPEWLCCGLRSGNTPRASMGVFFEVGQNLNDS